MPSQFLQSCRFYGSSLSLALEWSLNLRIWQNASSASQRKSLRAEKCSRNLNKCTKRASRTTLSQSACSQSSFPEMAPWFNKWAFTTGLRHTFALMRKHVTTSLQINRQKVCGNLKIWSQTCARFLLLLSQAKSPTKSVLKSWYRAASFSKWLSLPLTASYQTPRAGKPTPWLFPKSVPSWLLSWQCKVTSQSAVLKTLEAWFSRSLAFLQRSVAFLIYKFTTPLAKITARRWLLLQSYSSMQSGFSFSASSSSLGNTVTHQLAAMTKKTKKFWT